MNLDIIYNQTVMDNIINIPAEIYADDAVCFIANRYHVTPQEAVRSFLVQSGVVPDIKGNKTFDFRFEDNEIEILKGLTEVYCSNNEEERKYI